LRAPQSRMDVLSTSEIDQILRGSEILDKYAEVINRESAYEVLSKKIEGATGGGTAQSGGKQVKEEPGMFEKVLKSPVVKQVGTTLVRELTRGLLGVLGLGGRKKIW
jgi:uncharacterized protein